ncbi:MAG: DUF1592 domain-containing protein [Verrucomicrobia bacterium]|nr:DUF1592 domain-containing protein [Verrucomicrobiota bacterium]
MFPLPKSVIVPVAALLTGSAAASAPAGGVAMDELAKAIRPMLKQHCYDCHGDGQNKGRVAFDQFSDEELLKKHDLWSAVLKNVRAGLMPPKEDGDENSRPKPDEILRLANWIKFRALGIDPANPDPGRLAVRRLNRIEYRNTIRDLMGYDFNSEAEFPPDDTGNGFDNIGEVLTVSPLLLEKYLQAAELIVDKAMPKVSRMLPEQTAGGREFRSQGGPNGERLNITKPADVGHTFRVEHTQTYTLSAELEIRGTFDFDPGRGTVICRVDGEEWFREEVAWSERRVLTRTRKVEWTAGSHAVRFEIVPRAPAAGGTAPAARPQSVPGPTSVTVRIASVQVKGPLDPKFWKAPPGYARFFPRSEPPPAGAERDAYARDVLRQFATRAFRRPIEDARLDQLVRLAREHAAQPGKTFEEGIAHAVMAVLASPRFVFRIEAPLGSAGGEAFPLVDEHALASRLSYLFWSTMPDEELMRLAGRGELRAQLQAQVARMLKDAKAQAFVRNFTGQWLQARDIESVPLNLRSVFGFGGAPSVLRNRDGRPDFDANWRKLFRSETEMAFDYVVREDRSVLELIEADYAFLNEKLAGLYGVPGVTGDELRRVALPPGSVRGGVLTQGTVLAVTSNPTRTSPVKRGVFILDNILGTPPPPPPGDVPALEEAKKEFKGREPKLSEMLALHRADKLCKSCHERMDPLGLAFENFNALGVWRDKEAGQAIDTAGVLITGEKFADVRALKHVIAHERRTDFYRGLTEKILIYALGRGLNAYDVDTVDQIVARLEREGGRMSALLAGVIESAPFQRLRNPSLAAKSLVQANPTAP